GWEWLGHCLTNSQSLSGLDEPDERKIISGTVSLIRSGAGKAPRGWLGSGLAETNRTPDILKEHGIEYVADWINDDQPYLMRTAQGDLYSIPYGSEINDYGFESGKLTSSPEWLRMVRDQFDTLYRESQQSGRVMGIPLHPFITGAPHRIRFLDEALTHIEQHAAVWWATGSQIIDAYKAATG
ncbi:MAG TPA: polysaccharide deacetylase, partial [Chloroflexota bacterium]|nr:polysaccharide deacetylase [Chloroflexota bacterium]